MQQLLKHHLMQPSGYGGMMFFDFIKLVHYITEVMCETTQNCNLPTDTVT